MNVFDYRLAGAVLTALLVIFAGRTFLEIYDSSHGHRAASYTLPMPKGGSGPAAEAPAFDVAAAVALLPKASAENGKDTFKKCTACHTPDKGGPNRVGPNLYGVVGRDIGKHAGFAYSPAMSGHGDKWTYEHLLSYLHDPKGYIPNNKMAFVGVTDNAELADLVAYLRTLSDQPAPLPQ
jgi:cytochrome c